ncbi:MAG: hypothetical protein QNJ97_08330 [Myxococcota bacterium]|nr:hypothetical protein [Myxococcota bacterium]
MHETVRTSNGGNAAGSAKQRIERPWRRMAVAVPISVILHLVVAMLLRPRYRDVADYAVDFNVAEIAPGTPKQPPKSESKKARQEEIPSPPPENEPPEERVRDIGSSPSKKNTLTERTPQQGAGGPMGDGGPSDGGTAIGMDEGASRDGGAGGICMPDLFPFLAPDPSWLLWVSVGSFRETSLQRSIAATLSHYTQGQILRTATGFDPEQDIMGLLVAAKSVFNEASYRIVMGYDAGQAALREHLTRALAPNPAFQWTRTKQGWEGGTQAGPIVHLVGAGEVLVVDGPMGMVSPGTGTAATVEGGGGAPVAPETAVPPGAFPLWPLQPTCLSRLKKPVPGSSQLVRAARSFLAPDAKGHWPVALLATSDPRAIGLRKGSKSAPGFEIAFIRAYFSDPIRLEGDVRFSGDPATVAALASTWQRIAARTAKDPLFALAGLHRLFDALHIVPQGTTIRFTLTLTEGQVRAGLLFLQLQGEILERHLKHQ